jgi:hypothetical protein
MSTVPITGVEAVDRELERRAPFDSRDEAEAMAAQLLRLWRMLQPKSGETIMPRQQGQRRK